MNFKLREEYKIVTYRKCDELECQKFAWHEKEGRHLCDTHYRRFIEELKVGNASTTSARVPS